MWKGDLTSNEARRHRMRKRSEMARANCPLCGKERSNMKGHILSTSDLAHQKLARALGYKTLVNTGENST